MIFAKTTLAGLLLALLVSCGGAGIQTKTARKTTGIWKQEEIGNKTIINLKSDNSFEFMMIFKLPFVGEVINYESGNWAMEDSLISFSLVEGPIFRMEKGEFNAEKLLSEFKLDDQHFDMAGKVVVMRRDDNLVMKSDDGQKHEWLPAEKEEFKSLKMKYEQWERSSQH